MLRGQVTLVEKKDDDSHEQIIILAEDGGRRRIRCEDLLGVSTRQAISEVG